jgi:hypothetical protein
VQATLDTLRTAVTGFPDATHFYLLSGDCQSIKSAAFTKGRLDAGGLDHIEAVDFFTSGWIRTGMKEDRLTYRHLFNERTQKGLFYFALSVQRKLGLARKTPEGLRVMIGSQWWCLRRGTVEAILRFLDDRRDVARFFATTWIPDETFFQTLVRHLVPDAEITGRAPTFLAFTDYGMPVTFYNDHYNLLLQQEAFFARKISVEATELRDRLGALWTEPERQFQPSDEGRALHAFLTGRGRVGRRYAPRFWEERKPQRRRDLLLITCKKWHVAKRLVGLARERLGLPGVAFVFNEAECDLPDLGGIETSLEKRNRHRRALVAMLYDCYQADKLLVCVDPSSTDIIADLFKSSGRVRLLEVECLYSDAFLAGHAKRVGLMRDTSRDETLAQLLPTLRSEIAFELERIAQAGFPEVHRLSETAPQDDNTAALSAFFGISTQVAAEVSETPHLFKD